ncbi:E3 ubiquitin-protein ligase [Canna indica]|uniref:RING-type E3 ubiquitin transferase n=1 Tax=Canna indica TaxID=4628 RepID=A0AAQ3KTA8_9LILI|nr:E3 ubiquitin-protein ligase [Canna indica]
MDESLITRYWCHMCSRVVYPVIGGDIKCPICDDGFVEEMNGAGEVDTTSDLELGRDLSLWAPILLGMLGGGSLRRRRARREEEEDNSDRNSDLEAIERRRRRSSAILQLFQAIREGNRLESQGQESERDRERERAHMILIDLFNNALEGSVDTNQSRGQSSSASGTGVSLGDYFLGPGLDLLLQHLAETDPNFHGTPPAQKEAVEAMPTIKIAENTSCSICLEDFEIGAEAREMPCKHKFHANCILPWLELHSSCPVCRFQMPTGESKVSNSGVSGNRVEIDGGSSSDTGDGGNERGFWLPVPWPFNGLFSLLGSHRTENSSSTQSSSSSSSSGGNSQSNAN